MKSTHGGIIHLILASCAAHRGTQRKENPHGNRPPRTLKPNTEAQRTAEGGTTGAQSSAHFGENDAD